MVSLIAGARYWQQRFMSWEFTGGASAMDKILFARLRWKKKTLKKKIRKMANIC